MLLLIVMFGTENKRTKLMRCEVSNPDRQKSKQHISQNTSLFDFIGIEDGHDLILKDLLAQNKGVRSREVTAFVTEEKQNT